MPIKTFKSQAGREVSDPGKEIVRLAHEKMALHPTLTFSKARDLVMEAEPELARGWLCDEE